MREIKFRGERIDNGEFVYGSLVKYSDSKSFIYGDYVDKDEIWEINTKTVGQYTGLKDKNGKEIYEGDILSSYTTKSGEKTEVRVVEWRKGTKKNVGFNIGEHVSREIIGNIYEDPELLKNG